MKNKIFIYIIYFIFSVYHTLCSSAVINCEMLNKLGYMKLYAACLSSYVDLNFYQADFSFPNEVFDFVYRDELKELDGIFLGVGTFRVWQRAGYGNFKLVVFVDLEPSITAFNFHIYQQLQVSQTRVQFLQNIFGIDNVDEFKSIFDNIDRISNNSDLNAKMINLIDESNIDPTRKLFSNKKVLKKLANEFFDYLKIINRNPIGKLNNIFLNDADFLTFREKIINKNVLFLRSEIQNLDLWPELVTYFSQNLASTIPIEQLTHAVDFSNIADWMLSRNVGLSERMNVAGLLQLLEGKSTKESDNVKFLYTLGYPRDDEPLQPLPTLSEKDKLDFYYFISNGFEAIQALNLGPTRTDLGNGEINRINAKLIDSNACQAALVDRISGSAASDE
ncbi:MAG: hypothetical protein QE271_04290 [Bacteriovoracaceae bacterium]|nr:hypothetical protein [Bacteriovoracaceae bacterium]